MTFSKIDFEHTEDAEVFGEALFADGFEDALIGLGCQFHHAVAIYDWNKCVDILMQRDKMSEEEACEFMDFNVTGAWAGNNTPVFMQVKARATALNAQDIQ